MYDYVVMDAPPTGRITRFLNVNDEVAGLAKIGPIHNQAQAVMRVLKSPETAVHLVTLLEEMPVQETADGIAELRAAGLPVGAVIVNMVRPHVLGRGSAGAAAAAARPASRKALAAGAASAARAGRRRASGWSTRCWRRPRSTPSGYALEREQRAGWPSWACRCTSSPLLAEGMTWRASTGSPRTAEQCRPRRRADAWDGAQAPDQAAPDVGTGGEESAPHPAGDDGLDASAPPARRRPAARRPGDPHRRVLRLRAASARRPRPRPWACAPPSAAARWSSSPSTRRAGSPSRWASTRSTTPRAG